MVVTLIALAIGFGTAKFGLLNRRRYYLKTMSAIARADPNELGELAVEIRASARKVIAACAVYVSAAERRVQNEDERPPDSVQYAFAVLDAWSDPRLCKAFVDRAPGTAWEILDALKENGGGSYGHGTVREIVNQALSNEESILYREEEFSPLGQRKDFTKALIGDYRFFRTYRPLQGWHWERRRGASTKQMEKNSALIGLAVQQYFEAEDFWQYPAALYTAMCDQVDAARDIAWAIKKRDEDQVGDNDVFMKLHYIEDMLVRAVKAAAEHERRIPDYTEFLTRNGNRDPSIYEVIAKCSYKYAETLAMALKHDSLIRSSIIELWLEIFPISADEAASVARKQIRARFIRLLTDKVNQNLDAEQRWYPLVARLLISILGLAPGKAGTHECEHDFRNWFLETLRQRYVPLVERDSEYAQKVLPDDVEYRPEGPSLEQRRFRGDARVFELQRRNA